MAVAPPTILGRALADAVATVRARVGDPVAPVAIVTPSEANGTLARQQLALASDYIRVELVTPERVVQALARDALARTGRRPEPTGWLGATLGALVSELAAKGALGRYAEILVQPGWNGALARAVEVLEAAGVAPEQLEGLALREHADRLRILAALLRGVAARRGVDRVYAAGDLCAAARANTADARWAGAVVLGDRLLAPRVHEVVRAWLARRPHVELRPGPWHLLEPARMGLRAACSDATRDVLPAPAGTRLAALASRLFVGSVAPMDVDGTVTLARTPDEVREVGEAVRVVLEAVRAGTPLDRVAVVLPDPAQADVLSGHLARAGLPATWLTGPPLATTPTARFLLHALDVVLGDDTVPSWYELLRQPGLRLQALLGAGATGGRSRWRRLLARCGAVRGTPILLAALAEGAATPEEEEAQAIQNLIRALRSLETTFATWRPSATLGEHAVRWSKLLGAAWVPSPDRAQVLALLQGWGPAGLGPSVSLEGARAALRDALAAPALSGSLSDPAIRVVTPMGLLGGAFDLVVVTGLTEGRLPRRPGEDPVLPDGLLEQLNRALGTCLATSRELAAFEYRRFAAIVSSCTGRLWLSSPATQLLEGRPLLPSTLLLETASVLLGRRARFRDLEDVQVRCGSRARPWPDDAARAVGALEHRVAATALDRRAGLARLARHSTARRLLGLHRALDASAPTPWTGTLAPGILPVPGLDGTPLHPAKLAKLIADPGAFLVDEVLGVHRLAALYGSSNLAQTQFQDERLRDAFEAALDAGLPTLEAVATAWQAEIDAWRRHRVDVRDGEIAVVRAITLDRARALLAAGTLPDGARRAIVGPVSDDLPWVVTAEPRVRDTEVGELRVWRVSKGKVARDATDLVLAAMALPGTRAIRVATLDGVSRVGDLTTEAGVVRAWLERATHRATVGSWPWGKRGDLTLGGEPVVDTKGAEP